MMDRLFRPPMMLAIALLIACQSVRFQSDTAGDRRLVDSASVSARSKELRLTDQERFHRDHFFSLSQFSRLYLSHAWFRRRSPHGAFAILNSQLRTSAAFNRPLPLGSAAIRQLVMRSHLTLNDISRLTILIS